MPMKLCNIGIPYRLNDYLLFSYTCWSNSEEYISKAAVIRLLAIKPALSVQPRDNQTNRPLYCVYLCFYCANVLVYLWTFLVFRNPSGVQDQCWLYFLLTCRIVLAENSDFLAPILWLSVNQEGDCWNVCNIWFRDGKANSPNAALRLRSNKLCAPGSCTLIVDTTYFDL